MPFHSNVRVRCSQGALQEAFAGNVAVAITYYNAARASAQSKDFVFGDFRGKKTECPAYLVSVCVFVLLLPRPAIATAVRHCVLLQYTVAGLYPSTIPSSYTPHLSPTSCPLPSPQIL